jgi:hypothetical protein
VTDSPKTTTGTTPTPVSAPKSNQYVAASVDDDRLEPDAMRGSEHLLANVPGLENQEQLRIDAQKKSA